MDVALSTDTPSLPSSLSHSQMFQTFLTSTLNSTLILPGGMTDEVSVEIAGDVFTLSVTMEAMLSTEALEDILKEEEVR